MPASAIEYSSTATPKACGVPRDTDIMLRSRTTQIRPHRRVHKPRPRRGGTHESQTNPVPGSRSEHPRMILSLSDHTLPVLPSGSTATLPA